MQRSITWGLALAISLLAADARAESFDAVTWTTLPNGGRWRIERPNVKQAKTAYPQIAFAPGDRVTIEAGGCVQTGGRGKTWKRYVNPIGSNADELYSGQIEISGATQGMQRLQLWLGTPIPISTPTRLLLGYKDDNYGDNGYEDHDDGTGDQCKNVGAAWVSLTIEHHSAPPLPAAPRYNEVYQKSSHNSYESPKPPLDTQLDLYRIRSLEIDIHHSKLGGPAPADDFFVYHNAVVAPDSSCSPFSSCLAQLKAWHDRRPRHEVVTIFVDLKDPWVPSHSATSFDNQLRARLPGLVFGPADLLATCPGQTTLRAALQKCGWPTTDALRGKFIFVLTGDTGQLDAYAGASEQAVAHQAFIAPEIQSDGEVGQHANAVFFNLNSDNFTTGRAVFAAGFVSRVYYYNTPLNVGGVNDANNWNIAINNQIHHIATDEVNPNMAPYTITYNARGWPFRCMRRDCSTLTEP